MKILKTILIIFAVLAALFVIIGLFLPSKFSVERSIVIDAPQGELFEQVNDVKNWNNWSAWNQMDPDWKVTYSENTIGEGAWFSWVSKNQNVGNGKVTITNTDPNKLVEGTMQFEGMEPAQIYHKFEPVDGGVKVTMSINSDIGSNILMKYVFNLKGDEMIGGSYSKSLENLKNYVTNNPKKTDTEVDVNVAVENDSIARQDATEVEMDVE